MSATELQRDDATRATLVHELYLASERFEEFKRLSLIGQPTLRNKQIKIRTYNAYSWFLHHLYEFWVAIVKWRLPKSSWNDSDKRDAILTREAADAVQRKILVLSKASPAGWEALVRDVENSVDSKFGKNFRIMRNRTAHALKESARTSNGELSLSDFVARYHHALLCLFETAKFSWSVRDIESFDWLEIEAFAIAAVAGAIAARRTAQVE